MTPLPRENGKQAKTEDEASQSSSDLRPTCYNLENQVVGDDDVEDLPEPALAEDYDDDDDIKDEEHSWQTECKSLGSRLGSMLDRGLWFDCKLEIGTTGEYFHGHRAILASASPKLANKLKRKADSPVIIREIEPEAFKIVLHHIYTDQLCQFDSNDVAFRTYEAAHFLIMPRLKQNIIDYLLNRVNMHSIFDIFEFAKDFDISSLINNCLKEMEGDANNIIEGPEVETARAETLECLFAMPNINVTEMQLFVAAEAWVKAHTKQTSQTLEILDNNQTGDAPTSFKPDDVFTAVSLIRNALKQIRFLAMEPEEFATYNMSLLLSDSDVAAISLHLICDETYMEMPDGFSKNRETRFKRRYTVEMDFSNYPPQQSYYYDDKNVDLECPERLGDKVKWALKFSSAPKNGYYQPNKFSIILNCNLITAQRALACEADVDVHILRSDGLPASLKWKVKHNFLFNNNTAYYNLTKDLARSDITCSNNKLTFEVIINKARIYKTA